MIIYITSDEKKNMLNDLAEQHEWELFTEVMSKGSLTTFIAEKLQVMNHVRYLVVERSCIKENEKQLRDMFETVHTMWDAHVILLEEVVQDVTGEYQKVIYEEYMTLLYKYQENLTENLEYLLKGEKIPAENVYSGIWIGVMSSNSGAGATHVAIELTQFIANAGQNVCYVEANESGDLGVMAQFYDFEQIEDNHYKKDNIDYWHQMIDPEKKFAVLDFGKYSVAKMEMFNQCKIKIVITDGKPYRMADALNVLRYVKDDNARLWLNYLQQEEFEKISDRYLNGILNPIGRLNWHKSMLQGTDDVLYQETMKGYLNVSSKKKLKHTFLLKPEMVQITRERLKVPKVTKNVAEDSLEDTKSKLQEEASEDHVIEEEIVEELAITDEELYAAESMEVEQEEPSAGFPNTNKVKLKQIKSMMLLLLLVVGIGSAGIGITYISSVVKERISNFVFNNQDVHQETSELVDEELNINSDIKISVLEVDGADGYEVSYSTDKEFQEGLTVVIEVETADKAVESLTAGKTYYVRVRAFKFNEDGTKVYGEYTDVQKIET